jgi:SAM-dependent methyltransferase
MNTIAQAVLTSAVKSWPPEKHIRILELGAGTGGTTASLLPVLPPDRTLYIYTDISTFFTSQAQKKFKAYPFVQYKHLDIDKEPQRQGYEPHSFDVVVAANVLHDARHLGETLRYVRSLLASNGLLLLLEGTRYDRMYLITIGFLEGLSQFEDVRLAENIPFLSVEKWCEILQDNGFVAFAAFPKPGTLAEAIGLHVMLAQAPSAVMRLKKNELSDFLKEKLPEYMVPSDWVILSARPLTPNGKVDRRALPVPDVTRPEREAAFVAPRTPVEEAVVAIWGQILGVERVGIHDNFFELGGHSLLALQVMSRLREAFQVELPLHRLFEAPTVADLAERIETVRWATQGHQDAAMADSDREEGKL